jgi:hypothetical protein
MSSAPVRFVCIRWLAFSAVFAGVTLQTAAQEEAKQQPALASRPAEKSADRQAALEAALSKMLSGATLEGSFTTSGPGTDSSKLAREKYTLGDVKKIAGDVWLFPARIEYGGKDVTLPIPLPVRWAGDTPVVVVDEVDLPGFGSVSARVLFFDGHYCGYWKHGEHTGNLFGQIHSAGEKKSPAKSTKTESPPSGSDLPARKQPQQQAGQQ